MFDHIGVVFKDLKQSGDLYRQVLEQIAITLMENHTQPDGTGWLVFRTGLPSLWWPQNVLHSGAQQVLRLPVRFILRFELPHLRRLIASMLLGFAVERPTTEVQVCAVVDTTVRSS